LRTDAGSARQRALLANPYTFERHYPRKPAALINDQSSEERAQRAAASGGASYDAFRRAHLILRTPGGEFDRNDRADLQSKVKDAEEAAKDVVWGDYRFAVSRIRQL
jgi:hypothetical protein